MIPVLFEFGPLRVYSYGLMLGIAFLLGSAIMARALKRRGLDPGIANTVTIFAVVFGIAGAKLLYLLEEFEAFKADPAGMTFSAGGLTWYGGFLLALLAVSLYIRWKKVPFMKVWDCLGIALILAYGVGRVGCHLSGDGDYGVPTDLPWGMSYPNGVVPTLDRVHPTPIYEMVGCLLIFAWLWRRRTRPHVPGSLFGEYLILSGLLRLAVEFVRRNPAVALGLTLAQWVSLVSIGIGAALLRRRSPRLATQAA